MKIHGRCFAGTIALILAGTGHAGEAAFGGLGFLGAIPGPPDYFRSDARDISPDGRVIVGMSTSPQGFQAYRWENGKMTGLGSLGTGSLFSSQARGVSADGNVVVGYSHSPVTGTSSWEAMRWQDGTMIGLGSFDIKIVWSEAWAASTDGAIVVGRTLFPVPRAFRWEGGKLQDLGALEEFGHSEAYDSSSDGTVIVGTASGNDVHDAFRWTAEEGMVALGVAPPGSGLMGVAYGVSSDGSVVVGMVGAGGNFSAFRWSQADGAILLDSLGAIHSEAQAVSADGSVIVGWSGEAFLWTAQSQTGSIKEILENDHGLDLTGWMLLTAEGISDDGTVIVGWGENPAGQYEGWRAVIPRASDEIFRDGFEPPGT